MALTMIGQKMGMTQVFTEDGRLVVCTVIQVMPNTVLQIKKGDGKDGYNSVQLGSIPRKNLTKAIQGKLNKVKENLSCGVIRESRIDDVDAYQIGQEVLLMDGLDKAKFVDVEGISKGKGYQGVMKLHNMAGGPASHGASVFHRKMGSTGMRSTPGRCFPNGPRPSRMGGEQVTVQNLKIHKVIEKDNLLLVEGAVPGASTGVVFIRKSIKRG
jgi:large subunit ribosomal protein L3